MTRSTILILIGSHLAVAPRAMKEAKALRSAGAKVLIRGTWWSHQLAEEDRTIAAAIDVDFSPVADFRTGSPKRQKLRTLHRFARECFTRFGLSSGRVFGPGAPELLNESRRIHADLTMVHSEAGLWAGEKLLNAGFRVGVDFEDWFSQDLLITDRFGRPVEKLQKLERFLLNRANCCITTTKVMAEALAYDARSSRTPVAIPNSFPTFERELANQGPKDSKANGTVSFHWFSQTIGPGRGLESLAKALALLRGEWLMTLRGSLRTHETWFNEIFSGDLRSRIRVLDPVPNAELLSRTMSHDVGLALEVPYCANKDLTASNKIFEYLRAGLAVIATHTRGQAEVLAACPGAGVLIPPGDAPTLASAMQRMIDDSGHLESCRRNAAEAGQEFWGWEHHSPRLVSAITAGIER